MPLAFFTPGPIELIIVLLVAILLLGPTMAPKMARSLGSIIPSFKAGLKEINEVKTEINSNLTEANKEINKITKEATKTTTNK